MIFFPSFPNPHFFVLIQSRPQKLRKKSAAAVRRTRRAAGHADASWRLTVRWRWSDAVCPNRTHTGRRLRGSVAPRAAAPACLAAGLPVTSTSFLIQKRALSLVTSIETHITQNSMNLFLGNIPRNVAYHMPRAQNLLILICVLAQEPQGITMIITFSKTMTSAYQTRHQFY